MIDELLSQVLSKTSELESELAAKNWEKAIAVDKERLALLARVGECADFDANSGGYVALVRDLLDGIRKRLNDVDGELARCRAGMREFGQQRKASNIYHDTAAAK